MSKSDLLLMSHLMRRAGFGATRSELEELVSRDYSEVVEELLHPEKAPLEDEDLLDRYCVGEAIGDWSGKWIHRMVNGKRPLSEKIGLFWHQVFATGWFKSEHHPTMFNQIETFKSVGLSNLKTILMELSKDPAMIFWLDNCENHSNAPNENYGRELLELFSMGVGNYTEDDIKMAARAFTGWTFSQPPPLYPYGNYASDFQYLPDDHDDSEKTFLGETGKFNGEDIIDIIVEQPATARFISRHLYNFFVADEPQVPAWSIEPPRDPSAIDILSNAYFESGGEIRSVLRAMFNADFFKEAVSDRVKSPVELIASTVKLVGSHPNPSYHLSSLSAASGAMGQTLLNPPTVEGWHTGKEWIDGGALTERVNFAVNEVSNIDSPGVSDFVSRIRGEGDKVSPEQFVDKSLDLVGPFKVTSETHQALMEFAESGGDLSFDTDEDNDISDGRIVRMLQLIVASREFQFA